MHVLRKDLWANFIAQLACAVWWFHPLVWMLSRQLRNCQETACDDAVLFSGFEPATYAEALLAVAQTSTLNPSSRMPHDNSNEPENENHAPAGSQRRAHHFTRKPSSNRRRLCRRSCRYRHSESAKKQRSESDQVYKVGGDVTSPRVIYKVDPAYTEEARHAKIAGTVMLSIVIGADGLAHDINIVKSLDPGLDRKAAEASNSGTSRPARSTASLLPCRPPSRSISSCCDCIPCDAEGS